MKRRRGNNFLEQLQAKRETAKRAAAAKAEREPEPADPEDAPIRDPEGELQDFQEERRKVSLVHEFEEPTPEPAPSATEGAGAA
jgi:hypothetical protein